MPSTTTHCPECGAPVKSGDKQCWMCFRLLEWDRGTVKAAATSRFADHPSELPRTDYQTNRWAVVGIVLAAGMMLPAAGIACAVTCSQGGAAGFAILPVSAAAGVLVLVAFCVLIGMLGKWLPREDPS